MASRKRQRAPHSSPASKASARSVKTRDARRRSLVETLENRMLLAGPQLIGIQPNDGALITDGTTREVAPRVLTFRFDESQQIDPATLDGIRITRAGNDGALGTGDDIAIVPGSVTVGDPRQNEVLVRFADALPDDAYRVEVFAFDDPAAGIVGLRNVGPAGQPGELLVPSEAGARKDQIDFELRLGALVEAVVPQPVVRLADGSLQQRRDQIVVYFNEDPLFVENDVNGNPTERSAENPRFYQLLYTRDTARTTDDELYFPTEVRYDAATHTATLIFQDDLNRLTRGAFGADTIGGGTFRLRLGTAVDTRTDLIVQPNRLSVQARVIDDLGTGTLVEFVSPLAGEAGNGQRVRFENTGAAGVAARRDANGDVVINLGGSQPTLDEIANAVAANAAAAQVLDVNVLGDGTRRVSSNIVGLPALRLAAAGDTFSAAYDLGTLGASGPLSSLIVTEMIGPQPFRIELPGGNDDPGHRHLPDAVGNGFEQHINDRFGADTEDGVTTISYNFQSVYATVGSSSLINQVSNQQRELIRQAVSLWGNYLGVQFLETRDQGVTFALGDIGAISGSGVVRQPALDFSVRVDEAFDDSLLILNSQRSWRLNYGEDFFRTAMTGVGILLGLEYAADLPPSELMQLSNQFINSSINQVFTPEGTRPAEPVFPGNFDILHGQFLHRPDSIDIDMYRFVVDLADPDKVGLLTAETFAERLADASLLDTTLTLYKETKATAVTDFHVGPSLSVTLEAVAEGALGNRARVDFIRTDRLAGDLAVRITPTGTNRFQVDVPRQNTATGLPVVTVGSIVDAINADPFSSSLVRARITVGSASQDVGGVTRNLEPIVLSGGGMQQLARNDDYFSEDSLLRASLSEGVYYVGVAASGNDNYDPNIPDSGYGGRTQGRYELQLKFEAQVDEVDVIRDRDSDRVGVPGTLLDGDGDGVPGGVFNHWFQTRPLHRQIEFNGGGAAVTPGQTVTVVGASGVTRTFEFVPAGSTATPGNIAVFYQAGNSGPPADPPAALAQKLATAIASRSGETGVSASITDAVLTLQGEQTIRLSDGFTAAEVHGRTIFVDKTAGPNADGTLAHPFNNISNPAVANAFGASREHDIVRIVGNGGQDQRIETPADNFSYKIGVDETTGQPLEDGRSMDVPKGVTVMVDAGAAFKLRSSLISVGSTDLLIDRSGGVLQVMGTPRLIGANGNLLGNDGDVVFTSTRDRSVDAAAAGNRPAPTPGNWGGILLQQDLDNAEGRPDLEDQGIFLQSINHADIRYGGSGNLTVNSQQRVINPIQIIDVRPTITFNQITSSADAAMSAAPDSFEETSFQSPRFQKAGAFTSDYTRVGPDIHHNQLVNNSINGLFVRVETASNLPPEVLTVAGRWDDTDIVHYVAENIVLQGTPGGPLQDPTRPELGLVTGLVTLGGSLAAGTYDYRMTLVDANGFESLASNASNPLTVSSNNSSIVLEGLPPAQGEFLFRRLYRRDPGTGQYRLIAELNASDSRFVDSGRTTAGTLDLTRTGIRGRLDASLVIDPGMVVKLRGARFELGQGTQLLAEGLPGQEVVFTSSLDDRYGTGGTFDTNNDDNSPGGEAAASAGNWAGIYAGPTAHVSLDNAVVAFGGGLSLIEGQSRAFAALELQQASARVVDSRFEFNDDGQDGAGPSGRFGRLAVTPSTIFVRGSQPIIVGNTFVGNAGSAIDINVNSINADYNIDAGRQTGPLTRIEGLDDNRGPLVRRNLMDDNGINGMEVRGGTLTTESIWDDVDVVHVLYDSVVIGNFHSSGSLRLQSRPDESLVIKLSGQGTPYSATAGTGFTATGSPTDIIDRIGGSIHVLGQPGAPVVMTSLKDDTVGAGRKPDGSEQTDTNNDRWGSRPSPNDWRSVLLDEWSNARNVVTVLELESPTALAPGQNGSTGTAQVLGTLAGKFSDSDEQSRLGFSVEGFLSAPNDIDTYSFTGVAGTDVWIDVDRTSFTLDSVIELLDANGNVLARSDNSFAEVANNSLLSVLSPQVQGRVGSLQRGPLEYAQFGAGGLYEDFDSTNPRDAGIRVSLPGVTGTSSLYHFRVRSASVQPGDAAGGLTSGGYRFQVRLQEAQEFGGSTVKYSDIRYANIGVHVQGLPGNSPLLGEAQENEAEAGSDASNNSLTSNPLAPGQRAQYLGNLLSSGRGVYSVGGSLSSSADIDFFQFDVDFQGIRSQSGTLQTPIVLDLDYADGLSRPDTNISVFYDADGETGPAPATLVLFGAASNIAEDQSSPLSVEVSEILRRGSIQSGDPFIGPVSLPEGSYFVAITNSNVVPSQLAANAAGRREPVNSVTRIVDDHIDQIGGATAEGPVVPTFISRSDLPAGWEITTLRSSEAGHGIYDAFDNSRQGVTFNSGLQLEREPNDQPIAGLAQNLEALSLWSLQFDNNIGDSTSNTSSSIPHTTVRGALSDEADVYQLTVTTDGSRVIMDIDETVSFGAGAIDLKLWLLDANGVELASNSLSFTSVGAGGSTSGFDPFLEQTLNAGTYYVAVTDFTATYTPASRTFTDTTGTFFKGTYTLHVSQENHAADVGSSSNQSVRFDPAAGSGSLQSSAFNLNGYAAADQPYLYFNYLLDDDGNDSATVRVVRADGTKVVVASDSAAGARLLNDGLWHQARIDLGQFAGQSGLRIEFQFDGGGSNLGGDGWLLDDFIIGFAERGELITGATPGDATFITSGPSAANTVGEYQLEIRPGTAYGTVGAGSRLTLNESFDTNDRHDQQITVLAFEGNQLADGDRFTLSDGGRTVTFEFDDTTGTTPGVSLGNIRVPFRPSDSSTQIARAMRDAINSPAVQAVLKIEAAGADGSDTGAMTDNRIDLVGAAQSDFFSGAPQPIQLQPSANANALATTIASGSVSVNPGATLVSGNSSAGTFADGRTTIGLDSGIVLATGTIANGRGPNTDGKSGSVASASSNTDTNALSGATSVDSTSLAFTFQLSGNTPSHIYLQGVFASEEYRTDLPTPADIISVILRDTVTGVETQLAVHSNGDPISSETVNSTVRSGLYNDNDPYAGGRLLREFGYDGFTDPLVFTSEGTGAALLQPGRNYQLRLAIADNDGSNNQLDSALFIAGNSLSTTAPAPVRAAKNASGLLRLPAIIHDGIGDSNVQRAQDQVVIDSNRISDVRAIGIWSEPGARAIDPEDARPEPFGFGQNPFVQLPPIHSARPGAVMNLPALNADVRGGLAPGVVIVNNIIDQAGYAGISVQGQSRPLMIHSDFGGQMPTSRVTAELGEASDLSFGEAIADGTTFAIDAGGTRVIFEFEDLSGDANANDDFGSTVVGGDGWVDGHVPVYYRRDSSTTYNPNGTAPIRSYGSSQMEVMHSIYDSIMGSILVTNGLVQLVDAHVGASYLNGNPTAEDQYIDRMDFPFPAVYLQGASGVYFTNFYAKRQSGHPLQVAEAPVHEAPQPFARIVNNTIYGADGTESRFPGAGTDEPNDTLAGAVDTKRGVAHNGAYKTFGAIGDNSGPIPATGDVDMYRFEMGVGDRAIIDIDTADTDPATFLGINFPQGLSSFADRVVRYDPTAGGQPAPTASTDPAAVIGAPQGTLTESLSLGEGGVVVVEFVDNFLTASGDASLDLHIFETGSNIEPTFVEISEDGVNWVSVGRVDGATSSIDIDAFNVNPSGLYRFVRLTDDINDQQPAIGVLGADIDAVGAISSVARPLDTVLRVFNSRGEVVASNNSGSAPAHLESSQAGDVDFDPDTQIARDPFIDFTALEPGTYYVGVSSAGNDRYDPRSLGNRLPGTGGQGNYGLSLEVLAPRSFVFSYDGGVDVESLIGTTFSVTQIPDVAGQPTNDITFEFTGATGGRRMPNGNVRIPLRPEPNYRVTDVMRAISDAINGVGFNNDPAIRNHEFGNGPGGLNGPIQRATSMALGGQDGQDTGLFIFNSVGTRVHAGPSGGTDFTFGFGHDRNNQVGSTGINGTTTFGDGTTELYVLLENVAKVTLSPEAIAAGLNLDPRAGENFDQLLAETGVMVSQGASPSLLNNVIINTYEGVVREETRSSGFGRTNFDSQRKQMEVVVSGTIFQHNGGPIPQFRNNMPWPGVTGTGITTSRNGGTSNVNGGADDFNLTLGNTQPLLLNPAGDQFLPVQVSPAIDSALNSLSERDGFAALKQAIGIPVSNVLSPARDLTGQLRADDPTVAPPGGLGGFVFKDRGALDRADFVGPVADADIPKDNDADGVDQDPAVSFIQLADGTYQEFRVLLRDTGDAADPFPGSGIDDSTVLGPAVAGLRNPGAAVTIFENGRLLREGVDYTFRYDTTKNLVILTPLAGVWRNDRAYRIELNNRNRFVAVAPSAAQVRDGESFVVTDSNGGQVTLEYEAGYQLDLPETLTLIVPGAGTGAGGIADADRFVINDGDNPPVTFEFDLVAENQTLPGSVRIPFAMGDSPTTLAAAIAAAVQQQVSAGTLDVSVARSGARVVIGAESGAKVDASASGLFQAARTLALQVPAAGAGVGGIADGDTFTVSDGVTSITYEFELANGLRNLNNVLLPIAGQLQPSGVVDAIRQALLQSDLRVQPIAFGDTLFLGLPAGGSATTSPGQLALVGLARTIEDGATVTFTPSDGSAAVVLEFNRTDEETPDGTAAGSVAIDFTRQMTADQLAERVADAIALQTIAGLDTSAVQAVSGGTVAIGGEAGLGVSVANSSSLDLSGQPGVASGSRLQIFGPLQLQLPLVGGSGMPDNTQFSLTVGNQTVVFEYNLPLTGILDPQAVQIDYSQFDDVNTLINKTIQAINGSGLGLTPSNAGGGRISLGPLAASQVTLPTGSPLSTRRGIVSDGEQIVITQNGQRLVFEFEDTSTGGGVTPGAIAVPFQASSSVDSVAGALAAAIRNNRGNLNLDATAQPGGFVQLQDTPSTTVDVSLSPTTLLTGVPGGAFAVPYLQSFTGQQMQVALIDAINSINPATGPQITTLVAGDRGGNTFFIENATTISDDLDNYFLPAIADQAGRALKPNRDDNSTQFTVLLPTVGLDFGDAPDPIGGVRGRYPTLFDVDGARHVIGAGPTLGSLVDADPDGRPTPGADGDDRTIEVIGTPGAAFVTSQADGTLSIGINVPSDLTTIEGQTITIDTGVARAILEIDSDGLFDEDNFAISLRDYVDASELAAALAAAIDGSSLATGPVTVNGDTVSVGIAGEPVQVIGSVASLFETTTVGNTLQIRVVPAAAIVRIPDGASLTLRVGAATETFEVDGNSQTAVDNIAVQPNGTITAEKAAQAIADAIAESPVNPADVRVVGDRAEVIVDDEDGVSFASANNPTGVFNKGFTTPVTVTVVGAGILEAWIDFNADGDWDDPGEQIIGRTTPGAIFTDTGAPQTRTFILTVPQTTPDPVSPVNTYARFRVSAEGGLAPTGLALSGEVEDYRVRILPGRPPTVPPASQQLTYSVQEDAVLQAFDADGTLTPSTNDNSVLAGIVDPDGDQVAVFGGDVGTRRLEDASGNGGQLQLASDGKFTFTPDPEFAGQLSFTFRVTDVRQPGQEDRQLVSPDQVTVTINVAPANDPPVALVATPTVPVSIVEDQVVVLTPSSLIDGLFSPGPANEQGQPMHVQAVGFTNTSGTFVPFVTELGGSLRLLDNGSVEYTPPANYNGTTPDRFIYLVADDPQDPNQLPETAATPGTVVVTITAQNDPPTVGADTFQVNEDQTRTISVRGTTGNPGILDNDAAGPADEVAAGQTISLVTTDFPLTTLRGGTVSYNATTEQLVYTPPANFSGSDQFDYRVRDNLGATASGRVTLTVSGDNDAADFVGIDGQAGRDSLAFNESKQTPQQFTYDLSTWFNDPEADPLSFTVTSSNNAVVQTSVSGDILTLTLPSFGFGNATLTVTATNVPGGPSTTVPISVSVANTPDAPQVIGTLDPLNVAEDTLVVANLSNVFFDPDGQALTYAVTQFNGIANPTPAQIAASPLVQSISFVGNQMRIALKPNASGEVDIQIRASDGASQVTDTFTLVVSPAPDAPTGGADSYNVPVGSRLSVLDPAAGLLRNDADADGDAFTLVTSSIVGPTRGTLTVNADGTFVYLNTSGQGGQTDSFTYRLTDGVSTSGPITVTLNLTQSAYQNPLPGLAADVTADGAVSALDALRVINLLNRRRSLNVPVSTLTTPPPDYVDVDGNGTVTPLDALLVINELNRRSRTGSFGGEGEGGGFDPRVATTVAYAAPAIANLPQSNFVQSFDAADTDGGITASPEAPADAWQANFQVIDNRADRAAEALAAASQAAADDRGQERTDAALLSLLEDEA